MTSNVVLALIFNGVLVATCIYASVRGGRPERIGAGINVIAACVTTALRLMNVRFFAPAELVVLSIDMSVAVGFYWLAISTTRFWPVWAFGFAVADIFVSLVGGFITDTPLFAYHTGLGVYAYLALGALAIGTFRIPRHGPPDVRDGRRTSTRPTPTAVATGNRPRNVVR